MAVAGAPGTVTWRDLHREATERLESAQEARWLVEEAAPEPWPAALDRPVTERAHAYFSGMLERRAAGEPLQYVLGHWPFRELDLLVDPRVLIPRPETEVVVGVALAELEAARPGGRGGRAADLGTGSGAIALSLAKERPGLEVWATDASAAALEVAAANLAGLGGWAAPRVRLCRGSWFEALPPTLAGRLDLLVANPPYISLAELADLDPVVADHEPHDALFSGPTGLEDVEAVVTGAPRWLAPGGVLVVEVAPHQADPAADAATAAGLAAVRVASDLAGRPRALVAHR
ncbi:MAG TPA: peptide chain release factor N(5)-glutamine methyltransferase [Acidimicrobiales bacterium]|nr:peptide chain release factor N(5)-glutamine methyltransferase [Acidimicrobiales bacterium]